MLQLVSNEIVAEVPLLNATHAVFMEYDMKHNCVFSTDTHTIIRQCLNGNRAPEILVSFGVERIDGLAYDWMSENLYFCDSERNTIEVLNVIKFDYASKNRMRRTVIQSGDDIKPRNVQVHPKREYIFWTGWTSFGNSLTSGQIFRANLDGSDMRSLPINTRVDYPVDLCIDYEVDRIYWNDLSRSNYIASCDLDGKFFKILQLNRENFITAGLSIYKNLIYFLEAYYGSISILAKNKGSLKLRFSK